MGGSSRSMTSPPDTTSGSYSNVPYYGASRPPSGPMSNLPPETSSSSVDVTSPNYSDRSTNPFSPVPRQSNYTPVVYPIQNNVNQLPFNRPSGPMSAPPQIDGGYNLRNFMNQQIINRLGQ